MVDIVYTVSIMYIRNICGGSDETSSDDGNGSEEKLF